MYYLLLEKPENFKGSQIDLKTTYTYGGSPYAPFKTVLIPCIPSESLWQYHQCAILMYYLLLEKPENFKGSQIDLKTTYTYGGSPYAPFKTVLIPCIPSESLWQYHQCAILMYYLLLEKPENLCTF